MLSENLVAGESEYEVSPGTAITVYTQFHKYLLYSNRYELRSYSPSSVRLLKYFVYKLGGGLNLEAMDLQFG